MNTTEIRQGFQHVGDNMADLPIGYKRSDIGVIPQDWRVETISSVADVKTGPFGSALHERDYVDDGTPIITVEHLSEHGIIHHNLPMVSDADRSRLKSYGLRVGDIVFSRVGSVDRNALVSKKEDGWLFSGRLLRVRTLDNTTYSPYLSYHLHSEPFKRRVHSVAVGQTMASLNTQILKAVRVVLPTTIEQRAIAEALSDVDGLLQALEELIAKKRAIKQAAMQQLLTGKTRLPGFSGAWKLEKLTDFGVFRSGDGFPLTFQGHQSGDYPFFKVSDINNKGNELLLKRANHRISEDVRRTLGATIFPAGSVVFAKIGAAIFLERKRLLSQESCLDNNMMAFSLTVPNACERFFYYLFLRIEISKLVFTTALPSLSSREIGAISVSLPPLDEQCAIAAILSDMDAEIAALERRRDKACAVKQGMMQQLLTGRVRLVKPDLDRMGGRVSFKK